MSTHTQGKLHVTEWPGDANVPEGCSVGIDDQFGAEGGRDYYLFTAVHGDPDELDANARRLVACWNACEGVPTDALEQIECFGKAALPYHQLKAQNKVLLNALQHIVGSCEGRAVEVASAAIASAEKGGA